MIVMVLVAMGFVAQAQSDEAPYKRFPGVPPFELLNPDSATWFKKADLPKNQPVLLMVFNPECDHCQHQTEQMLLDIDQLKDIQIVFATPEDFEKMKAFNERYNLAKYSNIHLGRDTKFFLPPFYRMRNLPYLALYNRKGNLITTFDGNATTEQLLKAFSKK